MTSPSRRHRGMRTQLVVALHLAANGWPYAQSTGAGRSDVDITGVPGLSLEVKARRDFAPLSWIRQAASRPGLPVVVFRPDGMGETTVGSWPCLVRLDDLIGLLRAAGYGDPPDQEGPSDALYAPLRPSTALPGVLTSPGTPDALRTATEGEPA